MHSVFVAGSRSLSRLNPRIRERLDNIVRQKFTILIGDANGADKAVQRYLAKLEYRNVIVYSMDACRNNIGGWELRTHTAASEAKRDRFYYGIKDAAMVDDATCGFMLWDGVSKGTLTNIVGLLSRGKKVLLYSSPKKQFSKILSIEDLYEALNAIGIDDGRRFLSSKGIEVEEFGNLFRDQRDESTINSTV